jgi:diguanylate cyclase (GGDEF)-like protein
MKIKRIFGRILVDLGELEGDYRAYYLKNDAAQSTLVLVVVIVSMLASLRVDAILFTDRRDLFLLMVFCRGGFALITLAAVLAIRKTKKIKVFDRIIMGWIVTAILALNFFNFTVPVTYLITPFNVIFPFAIYVLSPLKLSHNGILAFIFSVTALVILNFFKTGMDPTALNVAAGAQLMVHILGLGSAWQIHKYRRTSYRAYVQEKDAKEIAAYLSNIDPLTGSLTRRQFFSMAGSEFLRYTRYKRPLSVLVLDADHFKSINDTHGHHAGDVVLKSMSLVVLEQKRAQDTFGRLGGEEFGLLLPETNLEQAKVVAERIQKAWEQTPSNMDGNLIYSTVSIGVAEAAPGDKAFDDLLRRADRMLYKAKERGKNQVAAE